MRDPCVGQLLKRIYRELPETLALRLLDLSSVGTALTRAHHKLVLRFLRELAWLVSCHLVVPCEEARQAPPHKLELSETVQLQLDLSPVDGPRRLP